ncbi:hypothetical protein A2982_03035 [candidate division WWE3 bacterium RIFCSPLOWO2_01_FULL_39_13]|uniref:Type II secretion system protein n=1 Tax=candidate division WWE3 bacterium RIFCSPLOWO2_01_FULL_39_13 TaxID=1802624 RepID=A0A1F4V1R0_UNCKA|nr:MAG: hypothetical protein A2982_03035 [candidate division WWE3 bacterium RIFCSPLOWO2_01_FULL_39_13]
MTKTNMKKTGFTLIEIMLYTALISIVLGAVVMFALNASRARVRSDTQQDVTDNLRYASAKISYEIRNAQSVGLVSPIEVTLTTNDTARNPTIIRLQGGALYMGYGNTGSCTSSSPCALTGNNVKVSSFSFADETPPDSTSKIITFEITIESASLGGKEYQHSVSSRQSVENRSSSEKP